MSGAGPDFVVGMEVQPRGAGLQAVARETKVLTDATRQNTEETRRAAPVVKELDASERRRRATLDELSRAVKANNLALAQARTDHARYQQQVEAAAEAKRKATGVVNSFRAAIVALQVAVATLGLGALVRDSVNVAFAFDRAQKSFVAATGSQQLAGREMAFVSAEADRLGLVLTTTAQGYSSLANAAKGTVLQGQAARDIFSSVSEAATVLGLSADQTSGALLGVQQTISKGKVTSEELVQQISERLPGAYQAMADALGITTAQLAKRLEQGKVGLKDLVGWAEELRKRFAAGLTTAVNSYQANINRLTNLTDQLKREVGEGFLSGFLTGFADLKKALSAEELKAAARDLGVSIGKALRDAADAAAFLAKNVELVKAALLAIVSLKAAAWFVGLAEAIAKATGATITFKAVSSNLALAGGLGAVAVALLAVIVVMEKYIMTTRLAMEAELAKVAKSQEVFGYYQTLKANKVGLTEQEALYAQEVKKTMEAELAATRVSLERTKAQLQASMTLNPFKYAQVAGPGRNVLREQVAEQEREAKTLENQLHILDSQWTRLAKLPVIKLPVDAGEVDKAAKKLADLLAGFQRAAEQAERIRAAQASEGAAGVARVTAEIERQNAAYQALHGMEKLSAASKAKLTDIIEGLVGRTQDANRATAEGTAETQRALTFTQAALDAEALLADAKSQTTAASRLAAIQAEAEAIARENLKEGDAEYVAELLTVIRTRRDYLDGIALEIAATQRQTEQAATLRQKRAELANAQEEGTAATRRLALELDAETEARARGVQVGTIWYQLLLAISAQRAQEVQQLDQQTAAQRRLNDVQANQRQARAEFTDWNRQREAASDYGSEIAGILESYGLLSEATRDLAIHEEALAQFREAGNTRTLEQIEAELQGYAAIEESLARQAATIELQAYIIQPGIEAWQRVGETIQSAVIDQIVDGNVKIEDLWKSMARTFLQAVAEMLKRWLLAHKAMQAEAMKTAAVNAAAAQAGGGAGGFGNAGGGTGGMGSLFGMGRQAMGGSGAAGAGWSTAASIGAVVAIYAAIYVAASAWVKSHQVHMGEVTFQLQQDVGGLVSNIHGNAATIRGLTKQVTDAGKAVVEWIRSLGGEVTTAVGTAAAQLTIGRSGQGKNTSWYVLLASGIKEWFSSQEEAFGFAMVEALRQAEFSGLDPVVVAAIKRNTFKTMEELQQGIADAVKVASFGQPETAADFRAVTAEMDRLRESMRNMIGTGQELADALARIDAQEVLLLQSQRDAITGKKRTADEEYQLNLLRARVWNAEREVRLQSIAIQILETKTRIANHRSIGVLIDGGGGGGAGNNGAGGLAGLGRTILWTAGVVGAATVAIAGSGDAALDSLNAYLASLQELYDSLKSMPPIDPNEVPKPGDPRGGRGGGGGGSDRKQGRLDLLAEVQGWGLSDIARQLQDAGAWFDDFKDRLKTLGFSAKKQAELLAAAADELKRRQEEIKQGQITSSRDYINAGTAAGGPLISALNANREAQLKLQQGNRDLVKSGQLTQREMRDLNKEIHDAGIRQRDQMIGTAADQLFLDLYGLLGDEQAAAQLRFDLTVAELELRREELRLAMLAAGWTEERMNAILGPLGVLIQRVKDAGPSLFGGGGGGDNGPQSTAGSGYFDQNGVWHPTWATGTGGGGAAVDPAIAARELLKQYTDAGRSEYELAVEKVYADFASIRSALGDTGAVAAQFAAAMGRLRTQFLEGVQEFYDALSKGQSSGLNVEQQYGAAMANYQKLLLAVQGGDLSQANALAQAGQDLVNLAGQMWGTSTGGFAELKAMILEQLRGILGIEALPAPGAPPPASLPAPPGFAAQQHANSEPPGTERQVSATNRVGEVVDFSGRKIERILERCEALLTKIAEKEPEILLPPQRFGNG